MEKHTQWICFVCVVSDCICKSIVSSRTFPRYYLPACFTEGLCEALRNRLCSLGAHHILDSHRISRLAQRPPLLAQVWRAIHVTKKKKCAPPAALPSSPIPARPVPARREFGVVCLGRDPLCQNAKLKKPVKKISFKCSHRCLPILRETAWGN